MIKVIDVESQTRTPVAEGHVRKILGPSDEGTRVQVAIEEVDPGKTCRLAAQRPDTGRVHPGRERRESYPHDRGKHRLNTRPSDARASIWNPAKKPPSPPLELRCVYCSSPYRSIPASHGNAAPAGYFFEEAQLRSLIDEKAFRERTFWVNKETGLSGSWDLQLGRMAYAPHAHSPRHVHHASKTSPLIPEHFYLIEKGTGEVKHDTGSLPVGPGSLVLIPAGEWHQLIASETGFDYIEFQAPFDFVTTMDHDPLGKNWYIKGTDDGTGKPKLWVQS